MKAYPNLQIVVSDNGNVRGITVGDPGMDLRDHFAGVALQAILQTKNDAKYLNHLPGICYQWADAMMEARKK